MRTTTTTTSNRPESPLRAISSRLLERKPECMTSTAAENLAAVLHVQPEDLCLSEATATRGEP